MRKALSLFSALRRVRWNDRWGLKPLCSEIQKILAHENATAHGKKAFLILIP
jgi:hypothetical protein